MPYIPYTDEQKQLANSVDLPTFLRMRGETLVPVGREFKLDKKTLKIEHIRTMDV